MDSYAQTEISKHHPGWSFTQTSTVPVESGDYCEKEDKCDLSLSQPKDNGTLSISALLPTNYIRQSREANQITIAIKMTFHARLRYLSGSKNDSGQYQGLDGFQHVYTLHENLTTIMSWLTYDIPKFRS